MKHFFVLHQLFFRATSTCFCRNQITFCATSNLLFQRKIIFCVTSNFLFWTSFIMLCHDDIFLFSHSNKNIITCQKINKLWFLCDTKKITSIFVHHNFVKFSFHFQIQISLHIVSMLMFLVVTLETKKLLPTCLISTEAVTK